MCVRAALSHLVASGGSAVENRSHNACLPRITTRSGASFKRVESRSEATMSSPREGEEQSLVADAGVSDLVRLLLEDRRKWDNELAAE